MLNQNSFWNCLIKTCVITCDMNSTLGSVVPLAMFSRDTMYPVLERSHAHLVLLSDVFQLLLIDFHLFWKKRHNITEQLVLSVWNIWSPASEVHPILPFFQISPPNMSLMSSSAFFLNSNDHLLKTWSKTIIEEDVRLRHHEIHVMYS